MDSELKDLLTILADDIDKKCYEIEKKKREEKNRIIFGFTCVLFIAFPIALMFIGIPILIVFIPIVIVIAYSMMVLSPIVLNNNFGGTLQ